MPLYLLVPRLPLRDTHRFNEYDSAQGFVVCAKHPAEARELITRPDPEGDDQFGVEGMRAWLNVEITDCVRLDPDGPSRVVLRDFHHG